MELKNNMGGYGLDHVAQDRDKWHALINPYPANVENMVSS